MNRSALGFLITMAASAVSLAMDPPMMDPPKVDQSKDDATGSMLFSKSMIDHSTNAVSDAYDDSVNAFKKDSSKPIIYYLMTRNNSTSWQALINLGLQKNGFTIDDLMWVMDEFASPNDIKRDNDKIFNYMFTMQYKGHFSDFLKRMLTTPAIPVTPEMLDLHKDEKHSIVMSLIEKSYYTEDYLKALKSVLGFLPVEMINDAVAVTREERDGGRYQLNPKFNPKNYAIVGWLMRKDGSYLSSYWNRTNYVKAGVLIVDRLLANEIGTGERDISASHFKMITLLHNQKDLTEEKYLHAAMRIKESDSSDKK